MFLKCLLLLFVLADIDGLSEYGLSRSRPCAPPRIQNGRFRMRQKSKLVKFICFPGFSLVGNKYATCRDGEWDVPLPVCVKPGCKLPSIENGLPMISHGGAWVVFFCYPQHKLVGSFAMFCDGRKWNTTSPSCVDTTDVSYLSCDFEDRNICGWTQDELHDFDWKRLNGKTPSSFLFTGPSYDHTFGKNGSGYYMYIESTSRLENDTARLISPIYESTLSKNGCFLFYYHMFGKTAGGLRVYQKPDNVPLENLLLMTDNGKEKYLLFEKWGNQGDVWYPGVLMLEDFEFDFQIIIEGIRGSSFTSDIAIDDVAVLQGENCSSVLAAATTPAVVMPDSCVGRCDVAGNMAHLNQFGCGCTALDCLGDGNACCPDFFDVCIFNSDSDIASTPTQTIPNMSTSSTTLTNPTIPLPQTQKLIAPTTVSSVTKGVSVTNPSNQSGIIDNEDKPTIPITRTTTTLTNRPVTNKPTIQTNPSHNFPTSRKTAITPRKISTVPTAMKLSTKKIGTTKFVAKVSTKTSERVTFKTTTVSVPTTTVAKKSNDKMKADKEQRIEVRKLTAEDKTSKSSGLKTSLIVIAGILCCCGAVWLAVWGTGARGRTALAWLRGRARHDPDVQYLNSHSDDD